MLHLKVLCVGSVREPFLRDAVSEYVKRLGGYAKVVIEEVKDAAVKDEASASEVQNALSEEAKRLEKRLDPDAYRVVLAIDGTMFDSEAFAKKLETVSTYDKSVFQFIIGGSYGLHPSIAKTADLSLSFSKMTFPHQLMRVILLEQLYRSMKIRKGESYHK